MAKVRSGGFPSWDRADFTIRGSSPLSGILTLGQKLQLGPCVRGFGAIQSARAHQLLFPTPEGTPGLHLRLTGTQPWKTPMGISRKGWGLEIQSHTYSWACGE